MLPAKEEIYLPNALTELWNKKGTWFHLYVQPHSLMEYF